MSTFIISSSFNNSFNSLLFQLFILLIIYSFYLKTMSQMNAQIKPQQIMKTMQDFEKQNEMMNMKEELSMNN